MNKNLIPSQKQIENRIFFFRCIQVMIYRDLTELYIVKTKVLKQTVKQNIDHFPDHFRFQLKDTEKIELVTNYDRLERLQHSSNNALAFNRKRFSPNLQI